MGEPFLHYWDIIADRPTSILIGIASGIMLAYWTFRLWQIKRKRP